MLKLGTMVTDNVTNLVGMLTHLVTQMDESQLYLFQPHGLDPDTGAPVEDFFITANRVEDGEDVSDVYLGLDVLGTEVEDEGSGFKGIAVSSCLHINGCLHLDVQPAKLQKNKTRVKSQNFDIRRLRGKAIKPMKEEEFEESIRRKPSPSGAPRFTPTV